jgi:hypothetical protein
MKMDIGTQSQYQDNKSSVNKFNFKVQNYLNHVEICLWETNPITILSLILTAPNMTVFPLSRVIAILKVLPAEGHEKSRLIYEVIPTAHIYVHKSHYNEPFVFPFYEHKLKCLESRPTLLSHFKT